ncbi:MAG: type III-A CRISPR-associated RAMP protein Csm4 [Limnospira sp. PMC 1291.21]|uniref:CRISPR system Cms protein Csm4 n=3 Tax=Limnospira TaxID=2596745 RepID=A0A9P1KHY5_9CYAN|nr:MULTISPECIES: type III-A CRISPR-associated RAMP protein Csm4 [Limnospira]EKD07454.1 CRISPR-associated RAMP protein Csm4 family [Arthrospira platensis C1]MDC0839228.1 type III-A CRISPR-associated RAMP protein Csm4 [Limnoraphis robusta]QJB25780.1 type III-A CRISPR-associated RAMP protein Csm4 [Limnospira fusiformis SAG 85.79]RAQ47231.1 type III-A CRISPR-associated RAMP protein Csm4 [Arthrospira sp. O9.13F]EDZ92517.1 CRISPR-associated RAMP protein, Csm4 family [Limnospira maxima CS-328]
MSNYKLVSLNFGQHSTHFGEVGIGVEETSERVRSDTLFSALIIAYARLFGKDAVEDLLKSFDSSPPFRVSSTFIYSENGQKRIDYLPKPLKFPRGYPVGNDLEFTKTYKKIHYLPLDIWQRWYQGSGFTVTDRTELIDYTNQANSSGNLKNSGIFDYSQAYQIHKTPKVAIDRTTRATNFYHTGFVQFNKSCGLYFLIDLVKVDKDLENRLFAALNLLGDEGLGGERSSGAGQFKPTWSDLSDTWQNLLNCPQSTDYSLISLLWENPISDTLHNDRASYGILERGGWISSPFSGRQLRRKKVRMFVEGSVFPVRTDGQLADVTPYEFQKLHKVYRSGIGFSLPIIL